ncbi:MAG: hypothetical protein SFU56_22195 [Capsulimonadales bacterium]|nr:hypothetical protein [Capsulimonadales bacterium]
MDTGRELEAAMRELEVKLPQLRRLMADATLPFGVAEEAEAWASSLLHSIRLTDSLASQLRRVLLGESTRKPADSDMEAPFVILRLNPPPVMTEMEAELERVFGSGDISHNEDTDKA